MMLDVTRFFAGFSGAVGTLFLLMAFSTDYWQLGTESCDLELPAPLLLLKADSPKTWLHGGMVTFYHEGLFWRCLFKGSVEEESLWIFLIGGHSTSRKICTHTYLFTTPIPDAAMATYSESAEVYRGLFIVVILLGTSMVMLAGFLSIGASSSARAALYRAAGGLFLTGGLLLLCVLVMHVVWFHGMSTLEQYVVQQGATLCPGFHLSVRYGPSFMMAPVGVFFCLLTGSLHLALARTVEKALIIHEGKCED
ncbi:transmembrane protein 182 isoform X1 [Alosa alosa]|uniref:transmembrane protein 182 isoform X1 n=1 Tax=Alosa alosa TaxID=278164 RepID=UPI0020153D7A|nr:transmembrane protein 182 isoform X1 [Alosa alosa]